MLSFIGIVGYGKGRGGRRKHREMEENDDRFRGSFLVIPQGISIKNLFFFFFSFYNKSGWKEAIVSYACQKLGSNRTQRTCFSLAATTNLNRSRTPRQVWGNRNEGVILLCVLRRSRSSHIWRLRRVSVGLSFDYG
ncbi:hypothetical protein L6452_17450 [Arctium lappa]|uniref:Uncharacterized protein n=1 Tax=Arctium lappa TaxID=4217 RepID=A0ACB9C3B3_ARCLA|nr:hypothetical protein L6452_17450 [Arctium lappa]